MDEQEFVGKGDISAFLPTSFKNLARAKKEEVRQEMIRAWNNSDRGINLANQSKEEYIRALTCDSHIIPNYHAEYYESKLEISCRHVMHILLKFDPLTHCLMVRRMHAKDIPRNWERMCSIEELCFVSVQSNSLSVQIARKNGVPQSLIFASQASLQSFVSLLDGYYRLSEKWFFSICRDISSPLLTHLKSRKWHGPVGDAWTKNKLICRQEAKIGNYIIRIVSLGDDLKLDFLKGKQEVDTVVIPDGKLKTDKEIEEMISHINYSRFGTRNLVMTRIPPSENDRYEDLLVCDLPRVTNGVLASSTEPVVIQSEHLLPTKSESFTRTDGAHYLVDLFEYDKKKVIVKKVKGRNDLETFLKTVNTWIHIKDDNIIQMLGVVIHPTSLVMEFFELGRLDLFLRDHQKSLKPVDLIEASLCAARALHYLDEKGLVHGCIRCRNLMVASFSPTSLKVKLTDPLCHIDLVRDKHWSAPELPFGRSPTSYTDVYALGTTFWELFSYGRNLGALDENEIKSVQPFGCPSLVWDLIHDCWKDSPSERLSAQRIVRDLSQILYEVYNEKRHNNYTQLNESTMKKDKGIYNKFLSRFGSSGNLSLRSSIMSSKTVLTGLGSSSDLVSLSSRNPYDIALPQDSDAWIIEANQLSLDQGKLLGQGCYGEVIKAVLTKWSGLQTEVVAVKRMNPTINHHLGTKDMRREIEIMKQLNHKNVVEIKGVVEDPHIMLVMEYLELGSLSSYLRVRRDRTSTGKELDTQPLKKFAMDIVDGMIYLESKSIIHRDLAARNVLVAAPDHVKISDFGLAQVISGEYYKIQTERSLPLRWYAPESIKYGTFSHKSDVWSFGVTLWEMYSFGKEPQYVTAADDSCLLEVLERKIRLPAEEPCPMNVYQIMMRCWEDKPSNRPSFQDLKREIGGIN
jgi:serine/threonine protein kinase